MKNLHVFLCLAMLLAGCKKDKRDDYPKLPDLVLAKSRIVITKDGRSFRDLNHNDKLDAYEDSARPTAERVADLMGQMTLEEKAGLMFIDGAPVSPTARPGSKEGLTGISALLPTAAESMDSLKMRHFNIWEIPDDPAILARWHNNVQLLAEKGRLGIPVTIASDPRHHLGGNVVSMSPTGFSQFCEMPGFAALDDEQLVGELAEVIRSEYLAVGIREALHPQIDLATEPRWPRISGNFSEDAALTARLVKPYIVGLQGASLAEGVACMAKHFPGGGPQKEGLDPHFAFQKGQIYPGGQFDYHLIPFEAAIAANTAAIMPYYGVPVDQTDENVAMAYNKTIITTLLREKYQYDKVVCTDWGLVTDLPLAPGVVWKARAWGVEHLGAAERVLKILDAGCDQFGGERRPGLVLQLANEGKLPEARIDQSVARLLRQKFALGLFDNPFVDDAKVAERVGRPEARALGLKTQKISMTLLKNRDKTLPLAKHKHKVYLENMDSATVAPFAQVVDTPEQADFAIIRLSTPWYPVDTPNPFARQFQHGDLDFKGEEKARILALLNTVPTIVDIYLGRPAVIPDINAAAMAVVANYGTSDEAASAVLFGDADPQGKLPFELPGSMAAVAKQKTDVPYDSEAPLYPFGHGLRYEK